MALEQVHAFYQKIASDESFRSRIQSVNSKEECSEIVKAAGFDFTPQEFEEYTARILESERPDEEVTDLSEEDLAAVAGGFIGSFRWPPIMLYGGPPKRDLLL
ncbi:Nif11-like leader peptide family natural product precursor [Microcystis sp. M061S2]|jgi:predicted ribosomally synthesized peptide with nif11-like leader|uniref:Nif11-like leader peptide family natural product precursor n=1 Tax=Microcystis sp. M061S2 TaxID=2771171 RepID=UPI0025851803|nr:Nif11-like leader peptide family natural product precursor [Microcystis sp. M061S2]MCA2653840.1 Nif11-like leader peptide family natural product precursor [Microcystis sp. M061S2]